MAQQQQQQGGSDSGMAPVWIMILLFITVFLIWWQAHAYIVKTVFFFNIIQAKFLNIFLHKKTLTNAIFFMQSIEADKVDLSIMVYYTRVVGDFMRYVVIAVLGILAIYLYKSNIILKFRRAHSMDTLRQQEQFNWPAIMPVINEDLVATDIDEGPWAMASSPMQFAKKHNLLKQNDILLDKVVPGEEMTAGIHRGDAKRIFTLQLGGYFESFEKLRPHEKALAAIFLARMNRDRDSATMIMEHVDFASSQSSKIDFSIAEPILKKYQNNEAVQTIVNSHAYILTVLASLIEKAREDGVVPTSEILWLKTYDRRLWYILNCIGRQTPYAEVAGVFAHWKAEKLLKRRSLVPMIDEATKALEIAIKEVKISPKAMQELIKS